MLSPPFVVAKKFRFVDRSAVEDPSGKSKNDSKNQFVSRARPTDILVASLEHAEDLRQESQLTVRFMCLLLGMGWDIAYSASSALEV